MDKYTCVLHRRRKTPFFQGEQYKCLDCLRRKPPIPVSREVLSRIPTTPNPGLPVYRPFLRFFKRKIGYITRDDDMILLTNGPYGHNRSFGARAYGIHVNSQGVAGDVFESAVMMHIVEDFGKRDSILRMFYSIFEGLDEDQR